MTSSQDHTVSQAVGAYINPDRLADVNSGRSTGVGDTFRAVFENSPFGIYIVDADFRLALVSAGAQPVFAHIRPLVGRDFGEVIALIWPAPFASEVIKLFHKTLLTGLPYHAPDTTERRRDSDTIEAYDWKIDRITMPDGRFGVVCHFYDLSEHNRFKERLRISEANYRILFDQAVDGILICDATGRYIDVNEAACQMLGYDRAELLALGQVLAVAEESGRRALHTEWLGAGEIIKTDWPLRHSNGAPFVGEVVGRQLPDGRLQFILRDISVRTEFDRALRESELRYRALVEASDTIAWRTSTEGDVIFAGTAWSTLTGQTAQETAGWGWLDAIHPDDIDHTIAKWRASLESATLHTNEFRVRVAAGGYRWFGVRAVPILTETGAVREWMGANTDIHDRKMAEEELRESEARLRLILDGAPAFIGILDADGTLREANATALVSGGLTRADVVGQKFWDCAWWSYDEAEVERMKSAVAQAAAGHIVRYDAVLRMQGDTRTTIDFMLAPVRDPDGVIRVLVPSGFDISARKRAESEIRESEMQLKMALRAAKAGTWQAVPDRDEFIASDQALALHGLTSSTETTLELGLASVLPDDRPRVEAELSNTLDTGEPFRVEFRSRQPDGSIRWLQSQAELRPDLGAGRIVGLVQDITEQKQREQQIRLLMGEVNHRSKNLLGVVLSVARQTGGPENREFVRQFSDRIRGLAVSQDLLVHNEWRGIGLDSLVRGQLSHFGSLIGTRILIHGPAVNLSSMTAQTIGMALHELGTNASKYGALADDKGQIDIGWALSGHDGSADRRFTFSWRESNGPPVVAPEQHGFGSTVIGTMARKSLAAQVSTDYAPSGFVWHLDCPFESMFEE